MVSGVWTEVTLQDVEPQSLTPSTQASLTASGWGECLGERSGWFDGLASISHGYHNYFCP